MFDVCWICKLRKRQRPPGAVAQDLPQALELAPLRGPKVIGPVRITNRWVRSLLHCALVGDVEHVSTSLAMHGIMVVPEQAAIRTLEANPCRTEQHLRKPEEERHTADHDHHRNHTSEGARKCDVTKSSRGQGGHGEIKCVSVICDVGVRPVLRVIHNSGHYEMKIKRLVPATTASSLRRNQVLAPRSRSIKA